MHPNPSDSNTNEAQVPATTPGSVHSSENRADINIAEELVKHGFAVWEEEKDQILTSPHKPISGHQAEGASTHSSLELNGHSKTPLHMESVVSPSEDKTGMFSMKD
ncbi:unnamed protein product [Timema podura]|uniref:Prolactin receptor n=1 Tax=Timema podura TaxID=61482 RepID=A0ABN7NRX9_TIMPD|nr:unnamed protein product [Timema podura]